jgi:glucose/arabinose dehydrogenase
MMSLLRWGILIFPLLLQLAPAQQFQVDTLASAPQIAFPVSIAFPPRSTGMFFFTEKNNGRVRIIHDDASLEPVPFVTLGVTSGGEQGLLGIDVHPSYPDSPFVYLFFTRSNAGGGTRDNMVVRFRDSLGRGIRPDTILVILRNNAATSHNGGNIHFGPDGKLYVTVGDYATSENSQDSAAMNLQGKILRLNPDGSVPPDNPFPGSPFWSIGHRNSFDFTFDALTGTMYCTENGRGCNDEVHRVPPRGNLGWPVDGNCTYGGGEASVRPLFVYPTIPLPALTGIVVYRGRGFPRLYGNLLFTGASTPALWSLTLTASGDTVVPGSYATLFTAATGFADVAVGPDGAIYLANGPYTANRILRLRPMTPAFSGVPPVAAVQDSLYVYTPSFTGTPPGVSVLAGPDGMVVDSTTWTVRWTPTNAQALAGSQAVTLRAENGGGFADQSFAIAVANVNDPPLPVDLQEPAGDTTVSFTGTDPHIVFAWGNAVDPDRDSLVYTVQVDTALTFDTPALMNFAAGSATVLFATLPRRSRSYYWRVRVSDGEFSALSAGARGVIVSFVTGVRKPETVEEHEALEQNFPNPFNPATSIKYTIPHGGLVRLTVFNLLGQEVALVFEGEQGAGTYDVGFEKANLPTGIYFYRIQAPGFVETKKMTITK